MLALIFAPFLTAVLIIVFRRALKNLRGYNNPILKVVEFMFGLLLFGGLICLLIGFFLPSDITLKRMFTKIGYYWLGFILYFFIGLLLALLIRLTIWLFTRSKGYKVRLARKLTVLFVAIFTIIMSVYGVYNAHKLRITNYEVNISKNSSLKEMNVVLISDLHLGFNVGIDEMKDMVDKINSLNPDLVILAGDIFDNEYNAVEEPKLMSQILKNIKSKYGNYAILGNHDIEEKILLGFTFNLSEEAKEKAKADDRMIEFISDSGFDLLYDSYVLIDNSVYVYGRPDMHKINFGNKTRIDASNITKDLDINKTIICVDHQPGDIDKLANAGVDIDLSGHTHNGQIWPGTISINWFWKNAYGLKQFDNMTSIVTSGVGLFGVNMRTGCYPEIVNIKINFKK